YRLTWPRTVMLERSAARSAGRLLQMWMAPEHPALTSAVTAAADEDWGRRQLEAETILGRLRETCVSQLKTQSPALFDAYLNPANETGPSNELTAEQASVQTDLLLKLIGQPAVVGQMTSRGAIHQIMDNAVHQLTKECETKLAEMANLYLDLPGYRLTGSDVALRHLSHRLRTLLEQLEPGLVGPR